MLQRATRPSSKVVRLLDRHLCRNARGLRTRGPPPKAPDTKSNPSSSSIHNADGSAQAGQSPKPPSMSEILAETSPENNSLLAPVHIPEDAHAVLKSDHPATNLLANSGLVVQRQIEMMNIFLGFEQANRYVILDAQGNHVGYMAEHGGGLGKAIGRQWFRTHRAFSTNVFDRSGKEVLRFHRPFSLINSTIRVYDPLELATNLRTSTSTAMETSPVNEDPAAIQQISQLPLNEMRLIGEAHSQWAPLRRKYELFLAHDPSIDSSGPPPLSTAPASGLSNTQQTQMLEQNPRNSEAVLSQFAYINEPFLSWDFSLLGADNRLLGSVNRGFRGFARELFTDTGSYALRMDSAGLEEEAQKRHIISRTAQGEQAYAEAVGGSSGKSGMTLDQRAVMLATAVTVDFDYFSRRSGAGGMGFMPLWMGGGGAEAGGAAGGAAAGGAAEAGAAEAGGAVVGGAGRAVGGAAGGVAGAGEGAMAGAGTMAGYEAMQRGMGRDQQSQEASPQDAGPQGQPYDQPYDSQSPQEQPYDQPYDSQSPQGGFGESQGGDVWGGGDQDPWNPSSGDGGAAGGGSEGGGGFLSSLWDSFFGD